MANPDDPVTVINVKGVSVDAWDRAKNAANKQDETMGMWLSRAINHRADAEAGQREFPPGPVKPAPANPAGNPANPIAPEILSDMMRGMAALATATGIAPSRADVRRAYALADDLVRDARGLPRKPLRIGKAPGQSLAILGKAMED